MSCLRNKVAAEVGSYTISKGDVSYRQKVIEFYYPGESRDLGLSQMVQFYTHAQILLNHGIDLSAAKIKEEAARIDRETLLPDRLVALKSLFKGDSEAYLRVYVFPTLVERTISFDFFPRDPEAQAQSFAVAKKFLTLALAKPSEFASLAAASRAKVAEFTVSSTRGMQWRPQVSDLSSEDRKLANALSKGPSAPPTAVTESLAKKEADEVGSDAKRWLSEVVPAVKPNQVYSKVIDLGERWLVAQRMRTTSKSDEFLFRGATFPKANYSTWLKGEEKDPRATSLMSRTVSSRAVENRWNTEMKHRADRFHANRP